MKEKKKVKVVEWCFVKEKKKVKVVEWCFVKEKKKVKVVEWCFVKERKKVKVVECFSQSEKCIETTDSNVKMNKKYNSYKDSGVEWIGEIPSCWDKNKLKYSLNQVVTGGTPDTSREDYWDDKETGINWISISDITSNGREIISTKKHISEKGLESKNLTILPVGSLIYSIYGSIGKVSRLGIPSTIHQGILGLETNQLLESVYLEYYLNYLKEYVSLFSSSNTQENLNQEKVSNFDIPLPPLPEQQQIVKFLDTKTELIDSLIEKTQKKIERLKEKRISLINEVVTKGLNPNVEMKDSGVEWIGEIPSCWEVCKLSFYCEVKDGTHSTPKYVDEGYPLVTQKDITQGKLDFSKTKNITEEDFIEINKRSNVVRRDIIMSMIGSIGNPTIVETDKPFSIKNVCLFKTSESSENKYFLHYFLSSSILMTELELNSRGGAQGFVSLDVLRNISYIKPPVSEQQQIVKYLDKQTDIIENTISNEEKRIKLLKEYRKSLISEVVTGKRRIVN